MQCKSKITELNSAHIQEFTFCNNKINIGENQVIIKRSPRCEKMNSPTTKFKDPFCTQSSRNKGCNFPLNSIVSLKLAFTIELDFSEVLRRPWGKFLPGNPRPHFDLPLYLHFQRTSATFKKVRAPTPSGTQTYLCVLKKGRSGWQSTTTATTTTTTTTRRMKRNQYQPRVCVHGSQRNTLVGDYYLTYSCELTAL